MHPCTPLKRLYGCACGGLIFSLLLFARFALGQAQWVHFGTNGLLQYYSDNVGNQLPDFSYAGYMGGGVALPVAPVKQTISPVGGDNTANIQNAINAVSALTPDVNGFRGAVLLNPGTYTIVGTLSITASGVVLRGSGNNTNSGSVLLVTGTARNIFTVGGSGSWSSTGGTFSITDAYVPLGATNFHVSSASSFAVGDFIIVQRPQTQPWINAIGMNLLTNPWTPGTGLEFERQITAISGNQITVDVPLCNPIESVWTTGQVFQVTDSARIQKVGVENLCAVGQLSDYPSNILTGCFLVYQNMKNCWAHDILLSGWGNGISLNNGVKWCTVQDCQYTNPATGTSSAAPAAYTIGSAAAMCLFQRCTSDGGYYHIMVTQAGTPGPDVFLNFTCTGTHYNGGPHQRWAAGALHDNINMAADSLGGYTPYLAINNRGNDGSGQGWAAGFSIMYNCQVPQFQLEQPATTTNEYNWTIGGIGSADNYSDKGIYDTLGTIVSPRSLYLEQLKERLGPAAVQNIGYSVFNLSATPGTQSVTPGNNTSFTVNVAGTNYFSDTVNLAVTGLPAGVSASFSTNSIAGTGSATLTVTASNSAAIGTFPLTIQGVDGNLTNTATVNLMVGTYAVSASPSSQTIGTGGTNISYTVNVTTNTGFSGGIALGVSGLPANSAASFVPQTLAGAGSSTLTVTTSNSTPAGNYTLTIWATNGAQTSVTSVGLIVSRPAANLVWDSTSSGAWDVTNSYNWFNPSLGATDQFNNGDSVLFTDSVGEVTNITIASGIVVSPSEVTNNATANNFTITGAGQISGSGGIVKTGASTMVLSTANNFSGGVNILGGILQAGNASALGSGGGVVISNGTLDVNGVSLLTYAVTASGPGAGGNGAIINSGASDTSALRTVTLAGDTTFGGTGRWDIRNSGGVASLNESPAGSAYKITKVGTNQVSLVAVTTIDSKLGDIDIQQGEFAIQTSTTQVGNPANTITVHSNATLEVWALSAGPLNKNIVMQDSATFFSESGISTNAGLITLLGNDTFNIGGTVLKVTNVVSGVGSLVKTGASPLYLTASNTFTGSTLVNTGTLVLTNSGSIGSSASIVIASVATLDASGRSDGSLDLGAGQTLSGSGTVNGKLTNEIAATVSPGISGVGILTVTGGAGLQGTTMMTLNQSGATNDVLQVNGALNYGGVLVLTNVAGTFAPGDSFKLFNAASYSGAFTNITPAIPAVNLAWNTNNLAANGVLSVVSVPTPPPVFGGVTMSAGNLILTGSNGVPDWNYYVLNSTNLALPLAQWTILSTNAFDGSGNFSFTNNPGAGSAGFYLLQLQ